MRLSPLDVHNREFRRSFRGYAENQVDDFLDDVVQELETLLKELGAAQEENRRLAEELEHYRSIESSLQRALVVAEGAAEDLRNAARQQAEAVVREAEQRAQAIMAEGADRLRAANAEVASLKQLAETFRIRFRAFLSSQLEMVTRASDGGVPEMEMKTLAAGDRSDDTTRGQSA